jgi:hypothetical protein
MMIKGTIKKVIPALPLDFDVGFILISKKGVETLASVIQRIICQTPDLLLHWTNYIFVI